jgi:saccharopine dehydrogenase-like NADP-dependent oxidoreductase
MVATLMPTLTVTRKMMSWQLLGLPSSLRDVVSRLLSQRSVSNLYICPLHSYALQKPEVSNILKTQVKKSKDVDTMGLEWSQHAKLVKTGKELRLTDQHVLIQNIVRVAIADVKLSLLVENTVPEMDRKMKF